MKSKKKIEKSVESFERLIEEHKEKIEKYGNEQPWLTDYWGKQIEEFEKQKEKEKKKLRK
jgi:hypothetical protein